MSIPEFCHPDVLALNPALFNFGDRRHSLSPEANENLISHILCSLYLALSIYLIQLRFFNCIFQSLNYTAMSPRPKSSRRSPPKSSSASKLAARVHALKTLALRKLNAESQTAQMASEPLAEEILFPPVDSDGEIVLMKDRGNATDPGIEGEEA